MSLSPDEIQQTPPASPLLTSESDKSPQAATLDDSICNNIANSPAATTSVPPLFSPFLSSEPIDIVGAKSGSSIDRSHSVRSRNSLDGFPGSISSFFWEMAKVAGRVAFSPEYVSTLFSENPKPPALQKSVSAPSHHPRGPLQQFDQESETIFTDDGLVHLQGGSRMSLIDIKRPPVRLEGRNSDLEGILLPPVVEKIRPHLPPFLRESSTWILSYSLDQHGISLNTLYRRSEENGPSLVVIRDGDGGTFGAFASEALHIEPTYFGNGECFLWKLSDDGDIQVYPATGANEYLIYGEPHMFAFGGGQGRFGLWISDDLYNGHSEPCDTFKNAQLSAKSEFIVVAIEIWSFKI